jgi:hypothetical protein
MEGTMLWFNRAKRHGFIDTDDGERLRVDEDGLAPGHVLAERCSGTRVRFDRVGVAVAAMSDSTTAEMSDARAVNVAPLPEVAARRARTRRRS